MACLVLSFDHGWYPSLDNRRGYNRGSQRWYIPKIGALLTRVAQAMHAAKQKRLLEVALVVEYFCIRRERFVVQNPRRKLSC